MEHNPHVKNAKARESGVMLPGHLYLADHR